MTTIITTAGVSLYSNTKRHLEETTGIKVNPGDDEMQAYLRVAPEKASAEANSLLKMIQPGDHLVFLVTEAPLAQRCIKLLEVFFKDNGFQDISVINLQFQDNAEQIEKRGIRNLISNLMAAIHQARQYGPVIINATSGLKALPPASTKTGIDEKIGESVLEVKHHYLPDLPEVCRKIASLPFVDFIYSEHFEPANRSRMGTFETNGTVRVIWASAGEANRLAVHTTTTTLEQTLKVRNIIAELLELQ